MGADPLANEFIWDTMYRGSVHGRKGVTMMAISAVDCALWDLKGRYFNAPVYRLLGGPTRTEIPAYASTLGYSIEPGRVAERAREFVSQGYGAMKWFFRHGPADGPSGMARNSQLVSEVRGAVGDDVDIMFDCWMSWDVPYTVAMAERLEEFEPRWLEEPVLPDKIESYAAIRRQARVPISGGEHEYTRWGLKALMDAEAVDVLQPDIYWAGRDHRDAQDLRSGVDLRPAGDPARPFDTCDRPPHRLAAAQPVPAAGVPDQVERDPPVLPRDAVEARGRRGARAETPGLGMQLDEAKIETQRLMRWAD